MDTPSYNNDQQPTTAADPRTTVRTNWLRFSWGQISNASKVLLVISFTIALLQVSKMIKSTDMKRNKAKNRVLDICYYCCFNIWKFKSTEL